LVFSSPEFLFFFLPLVLAGAFLLPRSLTNGFLLLASLVFYAWGAGSFVGFLLLSAAVNYGLGRALDVPERTAARTRLVVVLTVVFNLALLGYYKYANFVVAEVNRTLRFSGVDEVAWTAVALPIGISFFTFQAMSYVFDIVQGRARPLHNPVDFALYVSLFPQLIAGPIVRFHQLEHQLRARCVRLADLYEGSVRFSWGLAKKVVFADACGAIAEAAFDTAFGDVSSATAWLGTIAYTLQIYLDFSAYSDMAIGLGRLFGFTFPENFNNPYAARSVTDFWRRWHLTLSHFFRDYLYFPLGGSRAGRARAYFNLSVVFLLTGIWHGANWTFVVWGACHGAVLVVERVTHNREPEDGFGGLVRRAMTLVLVVLGWVLFRAESLDQALLFYQKMFVPDGRTLSVAVFEAATNRNLLLLAIGALVLVRPARWTPTGRWLVEAVAPAPAMTRLPAVLVVLLALVPYTLIVVITQDFSPFLYYRF
jgi:alginate O-acetyltransferase complex protein AlgI